MVWLGRKGLLVVLQITEGRNQYFLLKEALIWPGKIKKRVTNQKIIVSQDRMFYGMVLKSSSTSNANATERGINASGILPRLLELYVTLLNKTLMNNSSYLYPQFAFPILEHMLC